MCKTFQIYLLKGPREVGKHRLFATGLWSTQNQSAQPRWVKPRLGHFWNLNHNTPSLKLLDYISSVFTMWGLWYWQTDRFPKTKRKEKKKGGGFRCCCLCIFVLKSMFANLKQSLKHNQSQQKSTIKRTVCVCTYFFSSWSIQKSLIYIWELPLKKLRKLAIKNLAVPGAVIPTKLLSPL